MALANLGADGPDADTVETNDTELLSSYFARIYYPDREELPDDMYEADAKVVVVFFPRNQQAARWPDITRCTYTLSTTVQRLRLGFQCREFVSAFG